MRGSRHGQCFPDVFTACAVTRARCHEKAEPEVEQSMTERTGTCSVSMPDSLSVSHTVLATEQRADPSLSKLFDKVLSDADMKSAAIGYLCQDQLLVRKWVPHGLNGVGDPVLQVVVPSKFRVEVLTTSHDQLGHLVVRKTYEYILRYFFSPGMKKDVSRYIKTCQMTGKPNQTIKPAPLFPIPAISQPFEHLIIDCVGPLPRSKSGSNYLLTVMCQSTRYPAAYPLRSITAKSVVKALTVYFCFWDPQGDPE